MGTNTTSPPASGTLGNTANPLVTFGGSQVPGASSTQAPVDLSSPYNTNPDAFGLTQQDITVQVPYARLPQIDQPGGGIPNSPDSVSTPGVGSTLAKETLPMYMSSIEKLDKQSIQALQQQLYNAGYYNQSYYSSGTNLVPATGVPDDAFKQALKQAALDAVSSGGRYTVGEIIAQRAQAITAAGGGPQQPKPIRLTNPQDVAANAETAGLKVTGRALNPTTVSAIQANAEAAAQQQYTNSEGASGATSFSPSEAWLEQQVQSLNPQASGNYSVFNNFQAASSLFNQPQSPIANLYHQ